MKSKVVILFVAKQEASLDIRNEEHFPQIFETTTKLLKNVVESYKKRISNDFETKMHIVKIEQYSLGICLTCLAENHGKEAFPTFLNNSISNLTKEDSEESNDNNQLYKDINHLKEIGIQELVLETDNICTRWDICEKPLKEIKSTEEEKRMPDKIRNGLNHLNTILGVIVDWINKSIDNQPFFKNPQFVFRGITKFYPDNKEVNEQKSEKERVKHDNIKSSLAVRLKDTSKPYIRDNNYTRAFYVNALEDIIRKAKNMYPDKYPTDMSDLDILADIQHNGGATCLVDFSKNLLTAIWFACNADLQNNGYVYCYNIMVDMIMNDKLTIIRPEDENRKISELLAQTYRETNVCSDEETRFCLWEPSKKNNRIIRQDSVFVFGIEKFKVHEHEIEVVEIKAEWKSDILTAMKTIFNISGSSVYCDHIGFATNINKLRPYRKMLDTVYDRGYANMVKGHYSSALDFLKLAEIEYMKQEKGAKELLELHFSLGVCYKGLARQNNKIHYLENAIIEYGEVIKLAEQLPELDENKPKSNTADYYQHKMIRAYNARITLFYKLERFKDAINECHKIMNNIHKWQNNRRDDNSKDIKDIEKNGKKLLTSKYCEISMLELYALELLKNTKDKNDFNYNQILIKKKIDDCKKYSLSNDGEKESFNFFVLLENYYKLIIEIAAMPLCNLCIKKIISDTIDEWNNKAKDFIKEKDTKTVKEKNKDYILWNFTDMKSIIDSIPKDHFLYSKKNAMQDLTACAISLRDLYEMHGWWSVEQV